MVGKDLHILRIGIMLILGGCKSSNAQNLVPNPSFEKFGNCPSFSGQIQEAFEWWNLNGSCDYYHECGTNGFGIPVNRGGGGYARTGQAYGQLTLYSPLVANGREFLGVELMEPLFDGTSYRVQFHLSLMDSLNYSVRNIGAHFSGQPHPQNLTALLSLEPQVRYEDDAFLDDKIRWMEVSGTFIAQGGERFLAIGNFDDDAHTDTISVPDGGTVVNHPEGYWDVAGYFIDDVSVIPDSIYLGIGEQENVVSFYPNPATTSVTVEADKWQNMQIELYDATGRVVLRRVILSSKENIGVGHLPRGVYVSVLKKNGIVTKRRTLILQ